MQTASASTQSSKSADRPGAPFDSTSHNYTSARQPAQDTHGSSEASSGKPADIKIPDGRRNSLGEKIPSPVESWRPSFGRKQSWNREDLKREHVLGELGKKKDGGVGAGFTEVEGT